MRRKRSWQEQGLVRRGDRIVDIHSRSRGTYGAPRVHAELAADGVCVGRKRVARLMRQALIQGVHRRRRVATTKANPERAAAPDLVRREFTASGPDRVWMSDITYIPTTAGFFYLAAVIDVWSRRVVGWSMRNDLTTPLATDALDMAIATRRPDRVIHHSDRGSTAGVGVMHQPPVGFALSAFVFVVGGRGDRQLSADRLDPEPVPMFVHEGGHFLGRRSSSAWAKYADAFRKISLARRSSRFSRRNSRTSAS